MVPPERALAGRETVQVVGRPHLVFATAIDGSAPDATQTAYVAMGCFWGAERVFYEWPGAVSTAVGYQGGVTPNPTYEEVCTGRTGHAETVRVTFDPSRVSYGDVVRRFFESHDPTQGYRQGADVGTQYRSAIFWLDERQATIALAVRDAYQRVLAERGYGPITTEIAAAGPFYLAEEYHQQYLVANPHGYCGLGGTGVSCPVGLVTPATGS
jgi:peptide-methionine (S)-S-oxide reductase